MARTTTVGLRALTLTLLAACAPDPGPDEPTFTRDIRPLMLAHCVRCHGAGGTLNADPHSEGKFRGQAPRQSHLYQYDDPEACADQGCIGAGKSVMYIKAYIPGDGEDRMPPPPALPLSQRDTQVIVRWANGAHAP